jgi:hypothetical protein
MGRHTGMVDGNERLRLLNLVGSEHTETRRDKHAIPLSPKFPVSLTRTLES